MPQYGLVQRASNEQLEAKAQAEALAAQPPEPETLGIARHIKAAFDANRRFKNEVERRLLACLKARKGEYSDEALAEIQRQGSANPVFIKLTTVKCRAAVSWLKDILMPAGDRAWGLEPTPVPDLPEEVKEWLRRRAVMELQQQIARTGVVPSQEEMVEAIQQLRGRVQDAMKQRAKVAAERMSHKIADTLAEGGWDEALAGFINDFATYPTAFLKGPYLTQVKRLKWGSGFLPVVALEQRQTFARVSPFDAYPAPFATSCQDGDFIERIKLSRKELLAYRGLPGYNTDEINKAVVAYANGRREEWLWAEQSRNSLEHSRNAPTSESPLIDALHYWGSVPGYLLLEWGVDPAQVPDPLDEYEVDAIQVGRFTVRLAINDHPLGERPYSHASFEEIPGSIWGEAIPELMEDNQRMCNATARAVADNMALTSGPMVEIETDRLAEDFEPTEVHPLMVIQTKSDANAGGRRAVNFYQPASNAPELMAIFEKFDQKSDDVTNIPRYSYGNEKVGGAGRTLGGLDLLMNASAKGVRNSVSNIDLRVIKQAIGRVHVNLMLYDDDPLAKGDVKVVARGASALLIKDQATLRRQDFLDRSNNPTDMRIVGLLGRTKVMREVLKALDMPVDEIIPSDDELLLRWQAEEQAALEQAPPSGPQGKPGQGGAQKALPARKQREAGKPRAA